MILIYKGETQLGDIQFEHKSVLLRETVELLDPQPGEVFVDCTLGGAGHSIAIGRLLGKDGLLIGLDHDPIALQAAGVRLSDLDVRVELVKSNFRYLKKALGDLGIDKVDGILMDLGVSSPQLDEMDRGFSYNYDAPLDMRMDPEGTYTAKDLVNSLSEKELTEIIDEYGEERWASRIAQFIVRERNSKEIVTTGELVEIIKAAIPAGARRKGPHPAKRTFQALRIAVNEELKVLEEGLVQAVDVLRPGGRLAVITFHSLEDRIVKHFFKEQAGKSTHWGEVLEDKEKRLEILTKKPIAPKTEELAENPRARSAKLRGAKRL